MASVSIRENNVPAYFYNSLLKYFGKWLFLIVMHSHSWTDERAQQIKALAVMLD